MVIPFESTIHLNFFFSPPKTSILEFIILYGTHKSIKVIFVKLVIFSSQFNNQPNLAIVIQVLILLINQILELE